VSEVIDAVLCARVGASRLPRKPLLEAGGKTMLEHSIARLRHSPRIGRVVVATSDLPEDDPLASLCLRLDQGCFRGDPDDVLDRIRSCAHGHDMRHVGIFGADNPLLDPAVIDRVATAYLADSQRWDYATNNFPQTFPDGQEVEILAIDALDRVWREASGPRERVHVLTWIWEHPQQFSILNVAHKPNLAHERWTLDHAEDLELIRRVIGALAPSDPYFGMEAIVAFLDANPGLRALNARYVDSYDWLGRPRAEVGGG
jgi:spore coat polysaccharide biosynthesis protein SpsF